MKNKDIKEYFNMFPDDAEVSVLVVNPGGRKRYEAEGVFFITGAGYPVVGIEVGKELDMDEEEIAICEECEKQSE